MSRQDTLGIATAEAAAVGAAAVGADAALLDQTVAASSQQLVEHWSVGCWISSSCVSGASSSS